MFYNKRIKVLEKEVAELRDKLTRSQDYILDRVRVVEKQNELLSSDLEKVNKKSDEINLKVNFYNETIMRVSEDYKNLFKDICTLDKKIKDVPSEKLEKSIKDLTENKLKINLCYEIIKTISEDYKDLFKGICLTDAKAVTEQASLELKWEKDKLEKGSRIARKGADIIDKRKEVYDAMLDAQKKESSEYGGLKEQLKSFDWILEKINEKN